MTSSVGNDLKISKSPKLFQKAFIYRTLTKNIKLPVEFALLFSSRIFHELLLVSIVTFVVFSKPKRSIGIKQTNQ